MNIRRAKIVTLYTGGWKTHVAVENSIMSARKLRRILLKHGGEEREEYFWFYDNVEFWNAIKELSELGAIIK